MVGVMSLWTGTGMFNLCREHAIIHTLSCCLANDNFESTQFVTDSQGLEIADRLGWRYTTYVNAFNGLAPIGLRHIWALGKLKALSLQDEPFCHLDNDVYIHKPLPDRIKMAAIFAQSKDIPEYYIGNDMTAALQIAGFKRGAVAYNVGIIGGCDIERIHRYANEAIEISGRFDGCPINGTTTSMVLEQYFLGEFAKREKIRIEELIPLFHTKDDLDAVGYTHLIGKTKRDPRFVAPSEKRLARDYPAAYKAFLQGWKVIGGMQ